MRKIIPLIGLALTGCIASQGLHIGEGQEIVQSLPVTKQKQRIALLQKKLERAEKHLKDAQEYVEQLNGELHMSQLALIERQIENYEKQAAKAVIEPRRKSIEESEEENGLFLKEREMLQQMMQNGPSPEAFEAQVVLDRILRVITELKEEREAR